MSITKHPWIFAFFPAGKVPPFKSTTLVVSGSFVIFENCQVMSSCNSLRAWERKKGGVQASRKYYSVSWCCKHKRWISFAYDSINLLIGIWYKKWAVFFLNVLYLYIELMWRIQITGMLIEWQAHGHDQLKGPTDSPPMLQLNHLAILAHLQAWSCKSCVIYRFTSFAFLASLPVSPFHNKSLPSRSYSKHLHTLLKEPKAIESYWIADVWSCHL